jgi:hypothetical protein
MARFYKYEIIIIIIIIITDTFSLISTTHFRRLSS